MRTARSYQARYHSQSIDLVRAMLVTSNERFAPPFPDGLIVNEGRGANYSFVKGKTYRFRFISFAAFASVMVHFDSHTMQVIMNDASYVQKKQAYQIRVSPAQRYDVLISAIDRDRRNYPFLMSLDQNRDWKNDPPAQVKWPFNVTGQLVMVPNGTFTQDVVAKWSPVEDSHFAPLNNEPALEPVSKTIVLNFEFCRDVNNLPRWVSSLWPLGLSAFSVPLTGLPAHASTTRRTSPKGCRPCTRPPPRARPTPTRRSTGPSSRTSSS